MASDYLTIEHVPTRHLIRIFSKITVHPDLQHNGTPCWIWCANRVNGGYGQTTWNAWPLSVHRFMFAWLVEPIPRRDHQNELDHLCRRPSCCNPCHLELVSSRTNHQRGFSPDSLNSKKTHCPQGHCYAEHGRLSKASSRKLPVRVCKLCQIDRTSRYLSTEKGRRFKDRCNATRKNESPERRARRNQQRNERYARRKAQRL